MNPEDLPPTLRALLDSLAPAEIYCGVADPKRMRVTADHGVLLPDQSQKVWNHSPDGFSWGYGGSGPAQLALALLLHTGLPKHLAVRLHQDLKWAHVARWDRRENWCLSGRELLEWIASAFGEIAAAQRDDRNGRTDGS
jgi:hypothetical protein